MSVPPYPEDPASRTRWILERRGTAAAARRADLDPRVPYAFLQEEEPNAQGEIESVTTIFLTSSECPWRCLMCDLWKNTLDHAVPGGAIPAQIEYVLARTGPSPVIKLYNSGSFFDHRAVPPADYDAVARLLQPFDRVIVENHPALIGDDCLRFSDLIRGQLEMAVGLESADPDVLDRLNKRMTLQDFRRAADTLRSHGIALRAFILLQPPFTDPDKATKSALRSLELAFDCGATAATLIPTRAGNGAMEALADAGLFAPPRLETLEKAVERGLGLGRGRVFADLWDLEYFAECPDCLDARRDRLHRMNLLQNTLRGIHCPACSPEVLHDV